MALILEMTSSSSLSNSLPSIHSIDVVFEVSIPLFRSSFIQSTIWICFRISCLTNIPFLYSSPPSPKMKHKKNGGNYNRILIKYLAFKKTILLRNLRNFRIYRNPINPVRTLTQHYPHRSPIPSLSTDNSPSSVDPALQRPFSEGKIDKANSTVAK